MTQDILDTMIGEVAPAADPKAAEACFRAGEEADAAGERVRAIDEFRQAVHLNNDPRHVFRLAYALDLVGEEDEAVVLYEQLYRGLSILGGMKYHREPL